MALSPCFPKILHLFLLSCASVILNAPVHADPPYKYCPDANNGAAKAIFQNNENNLLLSLPSNASINNFYKASAGDYPSKAYGLFLCINYVSHQDCYNCIAMASQAIAALCPNSNDATNFFGRLNITGNISRYNPKKVSNPERFRSIVNSTLLEITEVAAFNSLAHMYATKQVAFSDKDSIYSLVQCTPDLSPEDCNLCLQAAIVEVLAGYQYCGARLLSCSCYLSYEFYAFYAGQTEASISSESSAGKNNQVKKLVILLAVTGLAFVLAAVLLRFYVCFFSTRKRMKGVNGTVQEIQMRDAVNTKEISSFLHHKFGGEENPFFDLATIWTATDYFSDANKLGEGGFGPVCKAWQMWSQDKGLELMDHLLIDDDSCRPDDFLRCVHMGLLCVQEDAFERPTMSSVMNMLKSETVVLGPPKRPAFSVGRFTDHYRPSSPDVLCENSTVSDFSAQ
ncbi:hypothetical protein Ancab_004978 [Ancistrocladus abbreviatus]